MFKKNLSFIIACIAFAIILSGCKKFLNTEPIGVPTDQTSWKTAADAEASINACYAYLRTVLNSTSDATTTYSLYTYGDIASDELSLINDGEYDPLRRMEWGTSFAPNQFYIPRFAVRRYDKFYQVIAQANRCLYFIPNMPLSVFDGEDSLSKSLSRNSYISEALFVRAFSYFFMSRVWGDVPLVLSYKVDISKDTGIARTPQAVVLDTCIQDLKQSVTNLPQDQADDLTGIRASKSAVYALLAHIYAWRGDYSNCYEACQNVINNTSASFEDRNNYTDIFKGQSNESIFEISQNSDNEGSLQSISAVTLMAPYNNNTQTVWVNDTTHFFKLFDTLNDLRYQNGFTFTANGTGQGFLSCIKYSNVKKLSSGSAVFFDYLNNMIVFRYTDIYLLLAEAAAAKPAANAAEARGYLNDVRGVNGLTPVPSNVAGTDLINQIFDERARELFMEGHRFYDMIRQMRLTGINNFPFMSDGEFRAGKYYWPIDPSLYATNRKLTQTPFWATILTH